jgi:hypothetical protein
MKEAADQARTHGGQISAFVGDMGPDPSPRPEAVELVNVALFADQGGFFFSEGVPNAQALATLQKGLPALDQMLSRLEEDLAEAGLQGC